MDAGFCTDFLMTLEQYGITSVPGSLGSQGMTLKQLKFYVQFPGSWILWKGGGAAFEV